MFYKHTDRLLNMEYKHVETSWYLLLDSCIVPICNKKKKKIVCNSVEMSGSSQNIRVKRLDYCIRGKLLHTPAFKGWKIIIVKWWSNAVWSRAIFMLGTFFSWPEAKVRETHKTLWSNKQWTYRGLGPRRG